MPLTSAQQAALKSLKRSRRSSTPRPQNTDSTEPNQELRRSARKHRLSAHTLESQEYEASQRASSRSCSPAGAKPSAKPVEPKAGRKQNKHPFGVPGDRPGRIVQPTTAEHDSSPEPLEPELSDVQVKTQFGESVEIIHLSRQKAIRLATKYLHKDASGLSTQTLKKVLQELPSLEEDDRSRPLDTQGGNTSPQLGSAGQTILGGRLQPPASNAPNVIGAQSTNAQLGRALGTQALGKPVPSVGAEPGEGAMDSDEPPEVDALADNSETEPEPETEVVELGPGDSVSQQPPYLFASNSGGQASYSATKTWTSVPRVTLPRTPNFFSGPNDKSDTGTVDSDEDTIHVRKRQRFAHSASPSPVRQLSRPFQFGVFRPTSSKVAPIPLRAAHHKPAHSSGSCVTVSSTLQDSSKPLPASDIKSALAWAIDFAKREARSHSTTNTGASTSRQSTGDFDMLAKVLAEIRTLTDSTPTFRPNPRHPLDISRSTDFISDHVAVLEAEAAIALGKRVRVRKQPALSDYPGLPGQIASLAIPELVLTAIVEGPYEGYAVNDELALDIFKEVADRQTGGSDVEDPPRPLRGLMIRRISVFRGDAMDRIRPLICYRHGFIAAPETLADLRHNINKAKSLLPNSFHCRDPAHGTDPYEDPKLREYIALVLFWAPDSLGVVYHKKHGIGEWTTGRHIKTELDAKIQAGIYESHVLGLLAYEKKANARFEEFREDAFWYGINHAGVSDDLHEPHQPVTRADEIRPDSPATKARAKGKARALN